jgi:3-oxoacyl-[acyl-carrier-protein] synthase-3
MGLSIFSQVLGPRVDESIGEVTTTPRTRKKMLQAKIVSTGIYAPPKKQSAKELADLIGKSEQWILSRTGVAERRIAEEPMDVMAAKAARQALGEGPDPDCIINASTTPLQLIPESSVFIQKELDLPGIPSFTVQATCLSFVVALINASSLIQSKVYKRILIVSSETGTGWRNMKEPESAALFGDGAAAVVVEPTPKDEPSRVLDWEMGTWPEGASLTEFRGAGTRRPPDNPETTKPEDNLFHMEGPRVFRLAITQVKKILATLSERNGMEMTDVDRLILHQASGRSMDMFVKYGFSEEKVVKIIGDYGNCIAASTPMTLSIANQNGLLRRGDKILIGGTGAGLSVAFTLLNW